jgi:hypothetical protein
MAKMKKAQSGESLGKKSLREGQVKRVERIDKSNPERAFKVAKRMVKRAEPMMKNGGMKKAEDGKKTAFGMLSVKKGIDNNPNPTFADKIAGAKKKAMSGMEMMKMGGKAAKQAAIAIAMKKAGKAPKKKMQYGGKAASMVPKGSKMKMGGKCKNGC